MQIRALSGFSENTIKQYGRPYSPLGNVTALGGLSKRQNNIMNTSETLLGNVHDAQGMGKIDFKVNTDSQVGAATHNRRTALLVAPRGAFLVLLRLNVWGMATLLSKQAFEISQAVTDTQTDGNYWWDVQARFRNGWYNLGGNWNKFVAAVNAGKNKKPFLFKIAPKGIKAKLKAQGIGGFQGIGAVDVAVITAKATAASGIYLALKPIIDDLFNKFSKDIPAEVVEEDLQTTPPSQEAGILKGGAGLIGVAILAALYFGTMKKK